MKAYRLEIIIVDHDELGRESIISTLENTKYPNYCIGPEVRSVIEADIGEWHDDHPLNKRATAAAELNRIFGLSLEKELSFGVARRLRKSLLIEAEKRGLT